MRRLILTLILALLFVATFGGSASAYGRFGVTDLMSVPTSGTFTPGAFGVYGNISGGTTVIGVDAGLWPNLEAGMTAWVTDGQKTAGLRIKYHLLSEKKDGLGLTIGLQDIGTPVLTPYIMAGKTLAEGFQGYLGIGGGWYDGILFGLSKQIQSANLFLEYGGPGLDIGARFDVGQNLSLDLGLADMDQIVAGLSYVSRF